ncbi:MAG: hypothetical protein O3B87_02255 [bacterium]|nr:hypothetical protein [bacterium]
MEFIFNEIRSNPKDGRFEFSYKLNTHKEAYEFIETITLPGPIERDISPALLQTIHVMLGLSYWKLYCPKHITFSTYSLSPDQESFFNTLYTQGLGEFYFKNNIDFRGLVSFPFDESTTSHPIKLHPQSRSLVGLGGGKDSLVVAQLLKKHHKPFDTFIVETQHSYSYIDKINAKLGKEPFVIKRTIDPTLIELSKNPDIYNGHIPISAIYAAIGILVSVVYDYSTVVVGNERSSDIGNTTFYGEEINHQWSKSHAFEMLFQNYIHSTISPQLNYLSLLRPLSEMQVMELFVESPEYFLLFSGCNRNFSITHQLENSKWCGECPKCAFVFTMLAAFVSKETATETFGQNLFAKESLLPTYQELWGEKGVKPFECVGTPSEMKLALAKIHATVEYEEDVIMKYFVEHILSDVDASALEQEVMNTSASTSLEKIINSL